MFKKFALIAAAFALAACTRIETGEVGLRIGFDKQVQSGELQAGSFNQTLFGEVITFPIKEVRLDVNDLHPQTADNSTMTEFDVTVMYSVTPSTVSDLYTTRSRGWHLYHEGDWYLMFNYMKNIAGNAATKSVRAYEALKVADNRNNLENAIKAMIVDKLKEEKLEHAIIVSQVQVTKVLPPQTLVDSANVAIAQQNLLKAKTAEVAVAEQEAKRIAALNSNAKAIEYMQAQAQLTIADAVKAGKVNTIILPMDFRGMLNVKTQ